MQDCSGPVLSTTNFNFGEFVQKQLLLATIAALGLSQVATAQTVIGSQDFDGNAVNYTGMTDNASNPDAANDPSNAFGVLNFYNDVLPFNIADDSVVGSGGSSAFANDNRGIVGSAKTDSFFAVNDADDYVGTDNGFNGQSLRATFSFDFGAAQNLGTFSFDMGAMGTGFEDLGDDDFDSFSFYAVVDGGAEQNLITFTGSDLATYSYRPMDSGTIPEQPRPLQVFSTLAGGDNADLVGAIVDKSDPDTGALDTFTLDISSLGAGTTVDIVFEAFGNFSSNDEGVVFDNMQITSAVPEPASLSLLALGATALLRRRK